MKYVVLIAQDETVWPALTEAEQATYMAAHEAFDAAVAERATMLAGEALAGTASATTVRHAADGNRVVTDGPYTESVEALGGFYLIDAPDLDTMLELCDHLPHAYTLEVRPVVEY